MLAAVIIGAVINVVTSLITVPSGTEWYVVLAAVLILVIAGAVQLHQDRREEEEREERGERERQAREREREEQAQRERDRDERERQARERERRERALEAVKPIAVPRLKREFSWKGQTGFWLVPPPNLVAAQNAQVEVTEEFESACGHFGVNLSKGGNRYRKAGSALYEKTRDARWIVVGENVARIERRGEVLWDRPPTSGTDSGERPLVPSAGTAAAYTSAASVVLGQIRIMREVTA
ncbi:hypothetical protein ACFY8N_39260 [Streptomyces collinus]|uniref:hypothetical protein n=1 Tax=Streptomyces collinus TaxID=42684 RepID=UPI0036CF84B3